jgi:Na+/proline symporter
MILFLLTLIFTGSTLFYYVAKAKRDGETIKSVEEIFIHPTNKGSGSISLSFFCSQMSLATVFIAITQLTPTLGWALIWSPITFSLGYLILGLFFAPKIARSVQPGETIHGFIGKRFQSQLLCKTSAIITVIGLLGMFAVELLVGAFVFRGPFGSADVYFPVLLCLSLCVIAYSILGGFKTVLENDFIQGVLIIGLLLIMFFIAQSAPKPPTPALNGNLFISPWLILSFSLINIPFPLIDMTAWQRIGSSTNPTASRMGLVIASFLFFLSWTFLLWASTSISGSVVPKDIIGGFDNIFVTWADVSFSRTIAVSLCFAGMAAAILGSADTALIGAGQTISSDLLPLNKPNDLTGNQRMIVRARIYMILGAVIGLIICGTLLYLGLRVADIIFIVFGSSLSLLPSVVYALFSNNDHITKLKSTAFFSITIGSISSWIFGITAYSFPSLSLSVFDSPIIAVSISSLIFVIGIIMLQLKLNRNENTSG